MANAVRIWEDQYKTLKKLPKKDQAKMALAMLEFAFEGAISVDLNYVQDLALTPMKPSLKITKTGGCPKGKTRNPAGLNQYNKVKGYPNTNPNTNPKGLDKLFINNNSHSLYSSVSGLSNTENISGLSTTRENVKNKKFIPPTLDEVITFAAQQNDMTGTGGFRCPRSVAEEFWAYYAAIGWTLPNDAQTPIRDWKPFLRKWAKNQSRFVKQNQDIPL